MPVAIRLPPPPPLKGKEREPAQGLARGRLHSHRQCTAKEVRVVGEDAADVAEARGGIGQRCRPRWGRTLTSMPPQCCLGSGNSLAQNTQFYKILLRLSIRGAQG